MRNKRATIFVSLLLFWTIVDAVWAGEPVQLRILYVNDFHGFAESYQPVGSPEKLGGIANLAGEVNRLRMERPTLLLAAGDMIQGHPWANLFEGKSSIEVMNAMDFSAMVLGNHEFDFGQKILSKRMQDARFPILAANIQGMPGLQPYVLKNIAGLKIAIIGLITEETPTTTHPKNVEGLEFNSMLDSIQKVLQALENKPDLVIVLSHLGLPADRRLAESVNGIQVIVGGHTHTRVESPMKINETLIVQAWEHAKVLGILDLTIQDRKVIRYEGRLAAVRPGMTNPDTAVEEIVNRYEKQAAAILDEVIGEAEVDLSGKGSRSQETNLGNMVADILRQETGADIALINGGGLRADILKGPIRMKDLLSVLPFSNHPVVLRVKGEELYEIFKYGLSDLSGTGGRFPQVSGIRLTYTPNALDGQMITSFMVGEKKLNPQDWYSLATNDFLAAGGDGYDILKKIIEKSGGIPLRKGRVVLFDSGKEIRDMVTNYIKWKKKVSASVEGRIQKEK
jgi:5'-nucleotidase / UDP-sugar diphosphatase